MKLSIGEVRVDPSKGLKGFASDLHGWAFTLKQFCWNVRQKIEYRRR